MRIFRPFIALLLSILLSAPLPSVFAQADLTDFSADDVGAPSMNFTIDQDGTAGAGDTVILKFGEVLSEILQFDVDAARFELSDDLSLEGNQLVDFKIENQASDPAACAEGVKGRVYYNTTNNRLWYCNASTWVDVTQDFESVFGTDTDKTITTTNTDLTVDTGTEDFVVDSNDWSVDQSGNLSIGGTLNANGVATLGDGGDTVAIDSSVWDISSAGVASGFTGFTSSGIIDFSVASQLRVPGTSEDSFVVNTDGDDATLQFGQNTDGQISYNDASNSFDFDGNLLMNLEDPVNDQDAVTKAYLDAAQAGEAMQGHVSNLGQLVDGGAGVGGVKAGTHTQVTDETLVLENDTFTITYNSGGSTIVLAAKDAPTAANCEFASGATAANNAAMATSILAALDSCSSAADFSGSTYINGQDIFLTYDIPSTVGNGTVTFSGSGFSTSALEGGKTYAELVHFEARLVHQELMIYAFDSHVNGWVPLSHYANGDTGTSQDSFILNSDADDATLQFGQNADGQIIYNDAADTFDVDSNRIINLIDPVEAQDAATKDYVDSLVSGSDWKNPVWHSTQLIDGGSGVGGIKAASEIVVSDEALVVENDTLTITYNSGGSNFVLTAKDAPTAANCEFKSGATALDDDDMAGSILAAIDACASAADFSGSSVQNGEDVYLLYDSVGPAGNGTVVASGSGFTLYDITEGVAYASLTSNESRLTHNNQVLYAWSTGSESWIQITGAGSIPDATTTEKGKVELATNGEVAAGVVVQGNDGRLHNQNTDVSTNSDSYILNNDGANATLQFGQNTNGQLFYNDATDVFDFDANRISNILDPASSQDAATKNYVDNLVAGLSWQTPIEQSNQLVNGESGTGGIRAGGKIYVSDEALVIADDIITVTYNSGGSSFVLTAKDSPIAASCQFKSGSAATDNADMATSILAAVDACVNAANFSGQSTASGAAVYLVHDTAATTGNGTIVPSGSGFLDIDMHDGKAYAAISNSEARLSRETEITYAWDSDTNAWIQITGASSLPDATTSSKGKVELATDGETSANVAVQGNDSRLHNQNTDTGSSVSTFTLDSDDTGGDVILKFGTTLAETLKWDTGNNYFLLSDALVVDGNVAVQGTTFTLDSDETGNPDQDADIVAEQGSESNGVIRYDDGNNRWEISNNGAVFEPIISGTVNAETLDTLDSAQFVRSDTSDSYTSGTLTFNSGTTLDGNGTIDFSGATRFVIRSGSANPGTCAEGDLFYNSTDNVLRVCTDTDTWTALGSGSSNADTLDTIDSLQFLRSDASDALTSGTLTINTGAALDVNGDLDASGATRMAVHQGTSNPGTCTEGDLFYNSTDNLLRACSATNTWSVVRDGGNSGTLDSLDSTQLLRSDTNDSFTSGILTFSSGTTLNVDGALDVNGVATIGDNGDNVTIDSSVWDISSPGVASGLTGITSTGAINFSGSSSIRLRESSSVPGTCTVGEQYFDTTTKTLRSCTTTNVFSSSTTGTNYLFGYDTTDQAVSSAGNFQTITFNNPTSVANGWTYSAGNFTTPVTGLYSITYSAYAGRNSKGDSTVTVRATRGGTEIAGSVGYTSPSRDDRPVALSNTFLVNLTAGDLLKFQLTGSTSSNSTGLYESNADGTVQPTITVTIRRIN